jgi:hypothetical protein
MKNVLRFIGVWQVSLSNVIVLALKGIMKTLYSLGICIYHSSGICTPYAADNMQIRLTDKQKIADAITSLEGKVLEMAHWEMNSMKKRLRRRLSGEGIIKKNGQGSSTIIYYKIKSRSYVENRESKSGMVVALIVLGGIYGMSNQGNNRKADAIAVLMENGS